MLASSDHILVELRLTYKVRKHTDPLGRKKRHYGRRLVIFRAASWDFLCGGFRWGRGARSQSAGI